MTNAQGSTLRAVVQQMRPHQWVKNLLLFIPLALAHQVGDTQAIVTTCWAFLAFSALASAVYTVNDLSDVKVDAKHPRKQFRPIVQGALSQKQAAVLVVVLLLVSTAAAWQVISPLFITVLIGYAVLTSAYSLWLKRLVLVDVLVLSALYTIRIVAGGAAADVEVSVWLLTFSLFFFTSLAFLKRYAELLDTVEREGRHIAGRGYHVGDAGFVLIVGVAAGLLAILVLTFYVTSDRVQELYTHTERLWFAVPLLLYWIIRMWLKAHRGEMHDDPIMFALKDPASYLVVALVVGVVTWAAWT